MSTQEYAAPIQKEARQRFEREKQAYWAMREELLKQYLGQWVAVVNGQVVAVGNKMGRVMEEAFRKTKSKVRFVSEVGHEDRVLRIRQTAAGKYDRHFDENLLGRDVINEYEMAVCAKRDVVHFEWVPDEQT